LKKSQISLLQNIEAHMTRKFRFSLLSIAITSAALTTLPVFAQEAERPEYLDLTEQQRQEYVTQIQEIDAGILIESDSADYSMYYSGGAYAATTVMGWVGMSTPATYGAYYALEWVGYIISESLERAGHDKEAAYFPHSDSFDVQLDYSNVKSVDSGNDFGHNLLYLLDLSTDGGSTEVMEVVADATASMGYGMYKGLEATSLSMYYFYDDVKATTMDATAINIACNISIPGVPCNSDDSNLPPHFSIPQATHGYSEFDTLFSGNPSSKWYRLSGWDQTYELNAQGGFTNFARLDSGYGNDYIFGSVFAKAGAGDDTLVDVTWAYADLSYFGDGSGQDTIVRAFKGWGGAGNDTLLDTDYAYGEAGDDLIINATNAYGGNDSDTIQGSDYAYGGLGADNLWGNIRNYGEDGNDSLIGSDASSQWHYGGDGNDVIQGNGGNDEIYGENGYDILSEIVEDNSLNIVDGGDDDDSLRLVLKNTVDLSIGSSTTIAGIPSFTILGNSPALPLVKVKNVETLLIDDQSTSTFTANFSGLLLAINYEANELDNTIHGGEHHDLIRGESGNDTLYGGNGNDTLDGGPGADHLYGEAGHDNLFPGLGSDYVDGGSGIDTVSYANLSVGIIANLTRGLVNQVENHNMDVLVAIENIIGSDHNDVLYGDGASNLIVGGLGDDELNGDDGNDILVADGGNDQLTGGQGEDSFELAHFRSNVKITDYSYSEGDVIQLDSYALGIPVDENGEAIISSDGTTQGARYHVISITAHTHELGLTLPSGERSTIATLQDGHDFHTSQIQFVHRDPELLYKTDEALAATVTETSTEVVAQPVQEANGLGLSWSLIPGGLKHVSVAEDGAVWGVNSIDQVYRRDGNNWSLIGNGASRLSQISVGSAEHVWGVSSDGKIWRWTGGTGTSNSWENIAGGLKQISVGADGTVWGVNSNNQIYRRNGNAWTLVSGSLTQVSVGSANNVWGINSEGEIWKWLGGNSWENIPGALKHVSVAADGSVWGVNAGGELYQRSSTDSNDSWTKVNGVLNRISVGGIDQVWGTTGDSAIYKRNFY